MARLINHMLFARKQLICGWHAVSCEWNVSHWDACEHSRRRVNSFTVHIRKKVNSKLDDMLQVLLNVPARSHGFRSAPPFTSLRVCSVCYVRSSFSPYVSGRLKESIYSWFDIFCLRFTRLFTLRAVSPYRHYRATTTSCEGLPVLKRK